MKKNKIMMAAMAGLLTGVSSLGASTVLAMGEKPKAADSGEKAIEKHSCKGQNSCKGQGGCAVEGKNSCKGQNECKSAGGCATDK